MEKKLKSFLDQKKLDQKQHGDSCAKVHPVVIFPFTYRANTSSHLEHLFKFLEKSVEEESDKYLKPVTVVNEQTLRRARRNKESDDMLNTVMEMTGSYSKEVLRVWSVDTCQMWLAGLGNAFKDYKSSDDVYWLIPGDFHYAGEDKNRDEDKDKEEEVEEDPLGQMKNLPELVYEHYCNLAVGEIELNPDNAKQLIDTYGTYGLLYNWFPTEADEIRDITGKPRTEFFAIDHHSLEFLLAECRWFPYEQTVFILLYGIQNKWKIYKSTIPVLKDDPQGRESLEGAMEQIERTERALKLHWRKIHHRDTNWSDKYRELDSRSKEIRRSALTILSEYLQ